MNLTCDVCKGYRLSRVLKLGPVLLECAPRNVKIRSRVFKALTRPALANLYRDRS
jgi:hypothetical protein